jgi:hypothetical protein
MATLRNTPWLQYALSREIHTIARIILQNMAAEAETSVFLSS